MRKPSTEKRRQLRGRAGARAGRDAYDARLILTTGDNIYASKRFLLWTGDSGDEDDDWFFTYFQPYRYVLNRIPVCPSIGNHDTQETEEHDDREQVMDNMYLRERLAGEEAAGRASVGPGLFYRFRASSRHRVRLLRHVERETSSDVARLFEYPKHWDFLRAGVPAGATKDRCAGASRSGIIRRSAPGRCTTTRAAWKRSVDLFDAAACAPLQRPRAQFPALARRTGSTTSFPAPAARSAAARRPVRRSAHAIWSGECHFLLVTIDGGTMTVRAIGESPAESLSTFRDRRPRGNWSRDQSS